MLDRLLDFIETAFYLLTTWLFGVVSGLLIAAWEPQLLLPPVLIEFIEKSL